MKKSQIRLYQILSITAFAIIGGLCLTGVITTDDVFSFLGLSGAGLGLAEGAGAAVIADDTSTTDTASTANADLLRPSIEKEITKMIPYAHPMDTMLREIARTSKCNAWEVKWYKTVIRGVEDTLAAGFDTSSSGTVNSTGNVHTIAVTNKHIWSVDDNIKVTGILGADGNELVLHVIGKNNTTSTLDVMPLNGTGVGGYNIPDMPINTGLFRMPNAKKELDAQTDPYSIYPDDASNYCQKLMAQVEESTIEKLHEKEVKWDINDLNFLALVDFRRGCESNALWGIEKKLTDANDNKTVYNMGGIVTYIDKSFEYTSSAWDNTVLYSLAREVFIGNSGSETRVLLVGDELMQELCSVGTIQKQIDAGNTEIKWGIKFTRIETNFGNFLIKYHDLFRSAGWGQKGIVIDPVNLVKFSMKAMGTRSLDLRTSGQRDADARVIEEIFCPGLVYPDAFCIVQPTTTS